MKPIYLDNAATTKVDRKVYQAMSPYFLNKYGNPSAQHKLGHEARKAIESAREKIASFLGADTDTIFFTGSATESINLCHKGLIENIKNKFPNKKLHTVTTKIEHKAVIMACKHLDRVHGTESTYLPIDSYGKVELEDIENAIRNETVLVSIMYVNNEVGTTQPIHEIGNLIKKINRKRMDKDLPRVYFHTDATQAAGYLDCDVNYLGVDFLSFSGHKIHAPKGVGVLYASDKNLLIPQMDGGGQENDLRSGTENVPSIVGIAEAVNIIDKTKKSELIQIKNLRDRIIGGLTKISGVRLTGHPEDRIHHIASFIIENVEGKKLVHELSDLGIMISTGSACSSGENHQPRVIKAMGISSDNSHGYVRFSLSRHTKKEEVDFAIKKTLETIEKLRGGTKS